MDDQLLKEPAGRLALLLNEEAAQPVWGRRATLAHASEGGRRGLSGVAPLAGLLIRAHRLDHQIAAFIFAHLRHHDQPTLAVEVKDVAGVDQMERNRYASHAAETTKDRLRCQALSQAPE